MPQAKAEVDELPKNLRPYQNHGLDFSYSKGDEDVYLDCCFCGRENKLSINVEKGTWRCLVCNEGEEKGEVIRGGNSYTFIRRLWAMSLSATKDSDYEELAHDRGYLYSETLITWQLAKSIITDRWLVPGFAVDERMNNLYRYTDVNNGGKWRKVLLPTSGHGHQLFGINLFGPKKPHIDLCEGIWDAIAWWEVLSRTKHIGDNKYVQTGNIESSLLSERNVVGIPGNLTFFEHQLPLFSGKVVNLMAQNDHEKTHPKTGAITPPASLVGMQRICNMLSVANDPPSEINILSWGEKGFEPKLPSGYDLRDRLTK